LHNNKEFLELGVTRSSPKKQSPKTITTAATDASMAHQSDLVEKAGKEKPFTTVSHKKTVKKTQTSQSVHKSLISEASTSRPAAKKSRSQKKKKENALAKFVEKLYDLELLANTPTSHGTNHSIVLQHKLRINRTKLVDFLRLVRFRNGRATLITVLNACTVAAQGEDAVPKVRCV
jgi:hypothetical protein